MKGNLGTMLVGGVLALSAFGCGDDDGGGRNAGCATLCTEAQAGSCTSVTGNCGTFCTALTAVHGPAGCTGQHDAYISCLNQGANACAVSCSSQETALTTCLTTYCLTHGTDADCVTLASSF